MTLERSRKYFRGIATFFIAVAVVGFAAIGLSLLAGSESYTQEDLLARGVAAAGIFVSAIMAWHGSRTAAIILLLWIASDIIAFSGALDMVNISAIIRTAVYIGLISVMIWHLFRYHRGRKEEGLPIEGAAWIRWGGKVLLVPLAALVAFGFWAMTSPISQSVMYGSEIPEDQLQWMAAQKYLLPGENPLFFYSEGVLSIAEGGNLLTDQYVGAWTRHDGDQVSWWLRLGEVCAIKQTTEGSLLEDAIYQMDGLGDDDGGELWLSVDNNIHSQFISRLKTLNRRKMPREVRAACDENREVDWTKVSLENGILPGIVGNEDVTDDQRTWLADQDYLVQDENIIGFYSYGHYHIREGGVLLTDRYFGVWDEDDGALSAWWMELGAICTFELETEGDEIKNARLTVRDADEDWFTASLPNYQNGAASLIATVKDKNANYQTEAQSAACEAVSQKMATEEEPEGEASK